MFSRAPSNYLMLGLDIMVTSELTVQFIEANNYPNWPKGADFMNKRIPQMGVREEQAFTAMYIIIQNLCLSQNDMIDLLFDCRRNPERFQHMHPGEKYGTWTLTWNECKSPPYNPCKEFMP